MNPQYTARMLTYEISPHQTLSRKKRPQDGLIPSPNTPSSPGLKAVAISSPQWWRKEEVPREKLKSRQKSACLLSSKCPYLYLCLAISIYNTLMLPSTHTQHPFAHGVEEEEASTCPDPEPRFHNTEQHREWTAGRPAGSLNISWAAKRNKRHKCHIPVFPLEASSPALSPSLPLSPLSHLWCTPHLRPSEGFPCWESFWIHRNP